MGEPERGIKNAAIDFSSLYSMYMKSSHACFCMYGLETLEVSIVFTKVSEVLDVFPGIEP